MLKIYNVLPYSISIRIRYIIELFLYKFKIHKNPWHTIKQKMISSLQKKYNIKTFIETWTYMWDMVFAQVDNFQKIYSIELAEKYYNLAVNRFQKNKNVTIIHWDSSIELWKLLDKITHQSLIFLDWHYSWWETAKGKKECPLIEELNNFIKIKSKINNHIIIIDDVRLLGIDQDYPTIEKLKNKLKEINNNYIINIKNDQMTAFLQKTK